VRSDNLTNFAYVGPNDGVTTPPEVFFAYHPDNLSNSTAIAPGETTLLRNAQTGKVGLVGCAWCKLMGCLHAFLLRACLAQLTAVDAAGCHAPTTSTD
jgi:hypothetical protein